ncbi:hypothetical protein FGADI_5601 [Fusarium gaditjirri]|uniref:Nephrocystin 3-like N-terminal domain-containing protein n=1 Tax=Fusarium gaditjirri TaxID=282569 RepID=A0A8H4TA96_9HYPO|nr:hypothetical protein FGADI_5601 [Fusarium gaditjirri]
MQSRSKRLKWALGGKGIRSEQVDIFEKLVQQLCNLITPEAECKQHEVFETTAWAEDIRKMLTKIDDGIKSEMQRDVFSWLGKPPSNDKYEDSLAERLDTTCEWIFDRPTFQSWLSAHDPRKPSFLWIHGPAGFGKTILCAHIAHHLSRALDTPVEHFFFHSGHESREDPYFALRSWLCQVAAKNSDAIEFIRRAWENDSSEKASRKMLLELFKEITTAIPGCIFIADGLDECSQLVSRDEPEIREVLERIEDNVWGYKISTGDVGADTAAFSQSVVDKKLSSKSEELRSAISEAMADRSQGQFLWIKMQEQYLRNGMSKKRLHEVVTNTPSGLDRLYDHNWRRIMNMSDWDRDRTFSLLRWTAFTFRPLNIRAVTEAVLITQFKELDIDEYPENFDDYYIRTEIVGLCGPLLEVQDHSKYPSPGWRTLHIPHFSVRQYLIEHLPAPVWIQGNGALNKDLSQVWAEKDYSDSCQESFLVYAAYNWIRYAKLIFGAQTTLSVPNAMGATPLFIASYYGHTGVVRILLDYGADASLPALGTFNCSPLWAASIRGSIEIVKELLSHGAGKTLAIPNAEGETPLHAAATHNHVQVLQLLLEVPGVPINQMTTYGFTPLFIASRNGYHDIVQLLLAVDSIDKDRENWMGLNPLFAAVAIGHLEVASLLLSKGSQVNPCVRIGQDLLWWARRSTEKGVVQLLEIQEALNGAGASSLFTTLLAGSMVNAKYTIEIPEDAVWVTNWNKLHAAARFERVLFPQVKYGGFVIEVDENIVLATDEQMSKDVLELLTGLQKNEAQPEDEQTTPNKREAEIHEPANPESTCCCSDDVIAYKDLSPEQKEINDILRNMDRDPDLMSLADLGKDGVFRFLDADRHIHYAVSLRPALIKSLIGWQPYDLEVESFWRGVNRMKVPEEQWHSLPEGMLPPLLTEEEKRDERDMKNKHKINKTRGDLKNGVHREDVVLIKSDNQLR